MKETAITVREWLTNDYRNFEDYVSFLIAVFLIVAIILFSLWAVWRMIYILFIKDRPSKKVINTYVKRTWPKNPELFRGIDLSLLNNDEYLKKHKLEGHSNSKSNRGSYNIRLACPDCSGVLTKKLNKVTGIFFYGCSNFPECRYEANDMADIKSPNFFN